MKQERHATTLAEDLQEASANTAEYGEFFTGLTGITDRKPVVGLRKLQMQEINREITGYFQKMPKHFQERLIN